VQCNGVASFNSYSKKEGTKSLLLSVQEEERKTTLRSALLGIEWCGKKKEKRNVCRR